MIRSAAYRIAIASSLAYATATIALGVAVYLAAHAGLQHQFDDRIRAEMSGLVSEYRLEGAAALRDEVGRREAAGGTGDLRYAIFAADGRRTAGNFPDHRPPAGLTTQLVEDGRGEADQLRVLAVDFGAGDRLVVAADWDALEHSDALILSLLALACGAIALIGAAGAFLLATYLRRRLSAISATAEGIMAGDLGHRILVGPRGDEFDRLSAVLNTMLDRIGELLDNLRQVSSEVAHDLRTPLTRLRNQLEAGLANGADPAAFERAIAQADELLSLFGAILRLSEVESGRLTASFRPFDLRALATELGESFAPAVEDGGRTLRCEIASVGPLVGDRELIAQAIINLFENAQTHTPPGTAIHLSLAQHDGRTRLAVSDDGPGVPTADRAIIVRRFARLDPNRTRLGHGLGLSLVAAIARAHGATLSIGDNAPGLLVSIDFGQ